SRSTPHQSGPRVSPPLGVRANHQVLGLMPPLTKRTLPSPRATLMPAVCGEMARYWEPSEKGQSVPLGWTMKMAAAPVGWGQEPSAMDGPQSGQKPVQVARCSVNRIVLEVPSGRLAGKRL